MRILFLMMVFVATMFCTEAKGEEPAVRSIGEPLFSSGIPKNYGRLVQVEQAKYLWFEAEDGTIRMVEIVRISEDKIVLFDQEVYERK